MQRLIKLSLAAACCAAIALAGIAVAQPKDPPAKPAPAKPAAEKPKDPPKPDAKKPGEMPDMDAKQAAEMEAWMKAATPGKMHEWLAQGCGTWDATVKMTMPDMPASESKATMSTEMLMEGRFQQGKFKGDFGGMPFEGLAVMGYNNVLERFEGMWLDSMGTGMMPMTGKMDGDKLVMFGEFADPTNKKMIKQKMITTHVNNDKMVDEFFHTTDGKEVPVMTITYTRTGKAPTKTTGKPMSKDDFDKAMKEAKTREGEGAPKDK